jgi:hypothetical protein
VRGKSVFLITSYPSLITPFIIVFQPDDIVFTKIVAELDFYEGERLLGRIAEAMVGFRRDMYVLAFPELQFPVTTNNIRDALHDDPMLAAPRVALETQTRTGFDFKSFDFVAGAFFQNLVATPRPLICFTSHYAIASPDLLSS